MNTPTDAARKLIKNFDLNPADEAEIAEMIAQRISDGDIGQFVHDLQQLRKASQLGVAMEG